MGVSITFTAGASVPATIAEAIAKEARTPAPQQPWILCEPPHFYPLEANGKLWGSSKLNLDPQPEDAAELAQCQTERNDFEELVHRLSEWSAKYQTDWQLAIDGHPLGVISSGKCDPEILASIEAMAIAAKELCGMSIEDLLGDDLGDLLDGEEKG